LYLVRLHRHAKDSVFPPHLSAIQRLLCDTHALKRIRQIVKAHPAYIVGGYPSNLELTLAANLDLPLYSGDVQRAFAATTKSGARRIFAQASVSTPPGALDIYEVQEIYNTLTMLLINNSNISTWVLKLEDDVGGRGTAYFSVSQVKDLCKIIYLTKKISNFIFLKKKSLGPC
jgi:hypothetical protein